MDQIFEKLAPLTRLADYLGVPRPTVYSWAARGTLPVEHEDSVVAFSRKLGRAHHVTLAEITSARKAARLSRKAAQ